MAASIGHASRFALLKIEDDEDNDSRDLANKQKAQKEIQASNASNAAKKKSKKKKKDAAEAAELRNLAFGGKSSSGGKGQKGAGGAGTAPHSSGQASEQQWEKWKQIDKEYTSEAYEQDLEQALLLSKLDYEEQKTVLAAVQDADEAGRTPGGRDKKKKKKDKPVTMSLDAFITGDGDAQPDDLDGKSSKPKSPPAEPDPQFFNKVETDATKIIQKEKVQEEYKKHYIAESARSLHYQEEIEKRDKEISVLRAEVTNVEDELKQVKKRNKQLCHILGQGEMKDKAEVLIQVQELTQIRDELTQEVSNLTSDLEKERSKVHQYKVEIDKLSSGKGGKHGSK